MENRQQLEEDFSYIRGALERQRRFVRHYVPIWFAALLGFYFIAVTVLEDLQQTGVITEAAQDLYNNFLWPIVVFAVIANGLWFRRKAPKAGFPCFSAWRETLFVLAPWVIFAGGIVLMDKLGDALAVPHDTLRAFYLAYASAAFMLMGFGRLNIVFGFGAGLGLGAVLMYFAAPPYPFTLMGVLVETGLVAGAWFDHRAYQRAMGARA